MNGILNSPLALPKSIRAHGGRDKRSQYYNMVGGSWNNEPGTEINPDSIKVIKDYYNNLSPIGEVVLSTSHIG